MTHWSVAIELNSIDDERQRVTILMALPIEAVSAEVGTLLATGHTYVTFIVEAASADDARALALRHVLSTLHGLSVDAEPLRVIQVEEGYEEY